MEVTTTTLAIKVEELEHIVSSFQITESYFSDILNSQLTIFSLIFGTLLLFYYILNWSRSKYQVQKEVNEEVEKRVVELKSKFKEETTELKSKFKEETTELKSKFKEETTELDKKFNDENKKLMDLSTKHESSIMLLKGEVYRALAEASKAKQIWAHAFIWWIRTAHQFSLIDGTENNRGLVRSFLREAKNSIKNMESPDSLKDLIGEYQELMPEINNNRYKIEKDLLDTELQKLLKK